MKRSKSTTATAPFTKRKRLSHFISEEVCHLTLLFPDAAEFKSQKSLVAKAEAISLLICRSLKARHLFLPPLCKHEV